MKRRHTIGRGASYYRQERINWILNILVVLSIIGILAYYAYVGNACVSHFNDLMHGKSVVMSL